MNSRTGDVLRNAYTALTWPPTYYACVSIWALVVSAYLVLGEGGLSRWTFLAVHICFAAYALALLGLATFFRLRPGMTKRSRRKRVVSRR